MQQNRIFEKDIQHISSLKKAYTNDYIKTIKPNQDLINIFTNLKNYKIAVCSNAIESFVIDTLKAIGIYEYIDYVQGNETIVPKPHPHGYIKIIEFFKVAPDETLIFEDSPTGQEAAIRSGAYVAHVDNPSKLPIIIKENLNKIRPVYKEWINKKMKVLIPMAGAGSRFEKAGYTFPKPLIEVNGKPMIQLVVENLAIDAEYIFIVQKSHYEKYNLKYLLNLIKPGCKIVQVDKLTEGAACTTLLAEEYIDNNPLLIANSDQYVEWNSSDFIYSMRNMDGGMLTFNSSHPKWSFAKVENGLITEVAEKKPISNIASVGIYLWNNGLDYIKYAKQMIEKNIRVNNEFYVCPVLNEAIQDGKKFKTFNIDKMWGLGTPEDLEVFLNKQ